MNLAETIYSSMPLWLQNLALSGEGYRNRRRRYGPVYRRYFDFLMRSQWWSPEQFERFQTGQLRRLLCEAIENVPAYREHLGLQRDDIEDINLGSLPQLPMLEKDRLKTAVSELTDEKRVRRCGFSMVRTSGTTGSPFVFPYDHHSLQFDMALRERAYRWIGTQWHALSARFSGRAIAGRRSGPPFWRYNASDRQWFFSSYHMTEENLPLYFEALLRIQPTFMDGYPSSLSTLAGWVVANGHQGELVPYAILTTAEILFDHQSKLLQEAFSCPVYTLYSSTEGAPFITECQGGGKHINPESGIIEVLSPEGNPSGPGECGEMVVTSFFQRSVPLIRYRIGDLAVVSEDRCPCGRKMPLVNRLEGRSEDMLFTTERGYISGSTLNMAFKAAATTVKECQLVQQGRDEFQFLVVPGPGFKTADAHPAIRELHARLGERVTIRLVKVERIPRGPAGKFRTVVNETDKATRPVP